MQQTKETVPDPQEKLDEQNVLSAPGLEIHKIPIDLCTDKFEANAQIQQDINFEVLKIFLKIFVLNRNVHLHKATENWFWLCKSS